MSAFFGHGNIVEGIEAGGRGGGRGGGWMNLKPIKQLSLRAITWVTSSFVLHSRLKNQSIMYFLTENCITFSTEALKYFSWM